MSIQTVENNVRVKTLFKEKKYREAIKFLSKKIKSEPNNHSLFALRARAFQQLSNHKRAAEDFNQASILNKESTKYKRD